MNERRASSGVLHQKVAIVTGASSGIGEATARGLADLGALVVLAARRANRLKWLAEDIEKKGGRALVVRTDVTDRESVEAMVEETLETFRRIDVLVNNAGVMLLSALHKRQVAEWDRMLDVNVRGLLYCTAAVLPTMLEQKNGHIVNVGSVAGRRTFYGGAVYSATKFAVRALSAGLREELSPRSNVRVTDIEPGVVATELGDHVTDEEMRTGFAQSWGDRTKLTSEDIARTIVFVVTQPEHVNVNELLVRPTAQDT